MQHICWRFEFFSADSSIARKGRHCLSSYQNCLCSVFDRKFYRVLLFIVEWSLWEGHSEHNLTCCIQITALGFCLLVSSNNLLRQIVFPEPLTVRHLVPLQISEHSQNKNQCFFGISLHRDNFFTWVYWSHFFCFFIANNAELSISFSLLSLKRLCFHELLLVKWIQIIYSFHICSYFWQNPLFNQHLQFE